ncbi:hypothetical protein [Prosthecobacter sp.]|uniref:hypothetical protein n=1 Tax=Prosthecobacter sp. TaxID=1965333 RepID=UPI00378441E0
MKPKLILLSLIGALLVGSMAWLALRSGPSIHFVRFHEEKYGRLATFRIANDTDESFSCYGYGLSTPFYSYRIAEPSGWKTYSLGWCGTGAGLHTLAPHSAAEIEVRLPSYNEPEPPLPFAVGIYFERGTAAQLYARPLRRPNFFSQLISLLREKINPSSHGRPDPTWSDLAHP